MEVLITIIVSTSVIFLLANNSNKTSTAKHRVSRAVSYPQPPNAPVSSVKPSTMEVMMTKNTGRQATREVNSLTKSNKLTNDENWARMRGRGLSANPLPATASDTHRMRGRGLSANPLPATASDTQKSKVYIWEQHMVWNYNGNPDILKRFVHSVPKPMTLNQSKELVDRAATWWWRTNDFNDKNNTRLERFTRVPRVSGKRRGRVAAYYNPATQMISLPEWARYPEVILHECAHFILHQHGCRNNCDGGHCAHFMGIYIHLLKTFVGMDGKLLTRSARASGIEVKSPSEYRFLF